MDAFLVRLKSFSVCLLSPMRKPGFRTNATTAVQDGTTDAHHCTDADTVVVDFCLKIHCQLCFYESPPISLTPCAVDIACSAPTPVTQAGFTAQCRGRSLARWGRRRRLG